jgi:AcrR family transcriptional regulator
VDSTPRLARRPTRADGRRNYDTILRVARQAFETKGSAASMEEIAQDAGVAIGTLYGHFSTRESLIEATTRESLTTLIAHGELIADDPDPLAALIDWLRKAVDFCSTFRGMVVTLTQGIHDETSHWHTGCSAMERCGANLLSLAQASGQVRRDLGSRELFDVVSAAAWVRENSPDDSDGSSRLLELFVDGISTTSQAQNADGFHDPPVSER